ncbi:MAG: hypothetical protein ACRDSN_22595 [Pseudonocardiaceae bacterium]
MPGDFRARSSTRWSGATGKSWRAYPAAAEDKTFIDAMAAACAYWLIETTTVALATLPSGDSIWGTSTIAERLALRAHTFAEIAEETGRYGALAALVLRTLETLGLADTSMPLYPAFGGPRIPTQPP